jgi:hypothetical protein
LQYADDTLIIMEGKATQLAILKDILTQFSFYWAESGFLQINAGTY